MTEAESKMKGEINQMAWEYIYIYLSYSQIMRRERSKCFHLAYNQYSFRKDFSDIFFFLCKVDSEF